MAVRQKGSFKQPENFEILMEGMIDSRMWVDDFSNLLEFTVSDYIAYGFPVMVRGITTPSEKGWYVCIDSDNLSNSSSWEFIGASIDDLATDSASVWSAAKIISELATKQSNQLTENSMFIGNYSDEAAEIETVDLYYPYAGNVILTEAYLNSQYPNAYLGSKVEAQHQVAERIINGWLIVKKDPNFLIELDLELNSSDVWSGFTQNGILETTIDITTVKNADIINIKRPILNAIIQSITSSTEAVITLADSRQASYFNTFGSSPVTISGCSNSFYNGDYILTESDYATNSFKLLNASDLTPLDSSGETAAVDGQLLWFEDIFNLVLARVVGMNNYSKISFSFESGIDVVFKNVDILTANLTRENVIGGEVSLELEGADVGSDMITVLRKDDFLFIVNILIVPKNPIFI